MDDKIKCIYTIHCNDPKIKEFYIGSTTNLKRRKYQHKSDCNNSNTQVYNGKLYKFIRDNGGYDNWFFVIEEDCKDLNKHEILELEEIYLDLLNPPLNTLKKSNQIPKWVFIK